MSESTTTVIDPAVMEVGQQQFMLCTPCHGMTGAGKPGIAPSLAGSEWVNGPAENLIRIQLRGLHEPIKVKGKVYEFPIGMPPQFFQTDEQIAAVLTFVRNSWGNKAPAVTPDMVVKLRSEVGKPQLTMSELIPPGERKDAKSETAVAEEGAKVAEAAPSAEVGAATATTGVPSSSAPPAAPVLALPIWVWLLAVVWVGLCLLPVLRRK